MLRSLFSLFFYFLKVVKKWWFWEAELFFDLLKIENAQKQVNILILSAFTSSNWEGKGSSPTDKDHILPSTCLLPNKNAYHKLSLYSKWICQHKLYIVKYILKPT